MKQTNEINNNTVMVDLYDWLIEPAGEIEGICECLNWARIELDETPGNTGLQGDQLRRMGAAVRFLEIALRRQLDEIHKLLDEGIHVEIN